MCGAKVVCLLLTAFNPESNGRLERSNSLLMEYLRHNLREQWTNWDECVPYAVFVYNTIMHTVPAFTLFELV